MLNLFRKIEPIIISIILFVIIISFFHSKGFNYINHLILEFICIFIEISIFLILIILPRWRLNSFMEILGLSNLSAGIIDIFHTITFPGGVAGYSNMNLSVTFWMLARFIQSTSFFSSNFYFRNEKIKRWKLLYITIPLATIVAIIISYYIPQNLFYIEGIGTTNLKSFLEIVYGILFILFGIFLRKEPYLFISGISLGFSEFSFIKYLSPFELSLWIGHGLKFVGLVSISIYLYREYLFKPMYELKDLEMNYIKKEKNLKDELNRMFNLVKTLSNLYYNILRFQNINELRNFLREKFSDDSNNISFIVRKNNEILFKTKSFPYDENLKYDKESYELIEFENIKVYFEKMDDFSNENYKPFFRFFLIYTKLLETLEQLKINEMKLKEVDDYRKYFLRTFSHDLRTPLNIVNGYLQLLKSGYFEKFGDKLISIFSDMEKSIKNALVMVDDILNLSKIETGEIKLKIEEVNIKILINDILNENKILLNEKGLNLNLEFKGEEKIFIDKNIIKSIFSNLISNSIKYTEKGGIQIFVETNNNLIFKISDTGPGIPKEMIDKIFLPFVKLDTEKGGFGLGLSLVKKYVEILNGEIKIESEINKGTIFTVKIPIKNFDLIKSNFIEKKDILIIDEEELSRRYLKNILNEYNIVEAENSIKGLEMSYKYKPKVIIVHYNLPDINGLELIKKLKNISEFKDSIFILYTVSKEIETDETIIINKDTKPEVLKETIDKFFK